ncbi:MAG: ATP-binding cassette domain-containing protein [Gaiellales bacterium]|nr:ATP-binding cassette domain-containing protein [Gaiellales bacterium]
MSEFALTVEGLTKIFGERRVVDGVTFAVQAGEVFGFLGPNGSGKTTTIRMALDIIRPDGGSVWVLGSRPELAVLRQVGYLPEEAGLPAKARVIDTIRYLARLKGLSRADAEVRANELLRRVNLYQHRLKRVDVLSQGMRQMIQFIVAIVHEPRLLILDEPFAGLDPLNVRLMKEILTECRQAGATIMFSTHIMADVEEMCERIALISDGRLLLFGDLADIRRERGVRAVQVQAAAVPAELRAAPQESLPGDVIEYRLGGGWTPERILGSYAASGVAVDRFEQVRPSLTDIFIEEVSRARQNA